MLFTCLDQGLRLLHPFLPFVSEELYQRLPSNPNKWESICIAHFPTATFAWNDNLAEEQMSRAQEVISALRSVQASLQILPKMNPRAAIVCKDESLFTSEMLSVAKVLARVAELNLVKDSPTGMLSSPVNAQTNIALDAKDLIDLNVELKSLAKKIVAAESSIANVHKKMAAPNYVEKTPESIKVKNTEKIELVEKELAELRKSEKFVREAMK